MVYSLARTTAPPTQAPAGRGQGQLNDIGPLGAKRRLAIPKIKGPQPPEALVEAEGRDLVPRALEPGRPLRQGFRVALAKAGDIAPAQPGAHSLLPKARFAGQHAAGKDVFAHEVGAAAVDVEQVVADGDDLQPRPAIGRKHFAHLVEIGRPISLADRLEHLDRGDAVEPAGDVAIVHQLDVRLLGQALVEQALARKVVLGGGYGHAGDLGADVAGGELGEAAPAAADFEHALAGSEVQAPRQGPVLVILRLGEGLSGLLEPGRGIGHARIEPAGVKRIAQVVVRQNVAL